MITTPGRLAYCMVALAVMWASMWTAVESAPNRNNRLPEDWTDGGAVSGTTYSVIVEATNPRPSSQFGDKQRVQLYTSGLFGGGRVVSVQYVPHLPDEADRSLTVRGHPGGVDKRVRMVFLSDMELEPYPDKVSHLKDACADNSETTIMVIVDELCEIIDPPQWLPTTCLSNIIRVYPFNNERLGSMPPEAFMTLGPRGTFPFVSRERINEASTRPLFLSLQVHVETSPRRGALVSLVEEFSRLNPEVPLSCRGRHQPARFYSVSEWQTLLLDSRFTICPGGHNPDTFRVWEALEAGSIPIVSKLDYTHPPRFDNQSCGVGGVAWNVVASSPFAKTVSVSSWKELPERLHDLLQKSEEDIHKLQDDCMAWYAARMNHTYASLLTFGEGNDMLPQQGLIIDAPYGV